MRNEKIQKLVMTGVFAALSYVVFTFLQIKISLPGGDATSIHLGNAVCVLGALIMGGLYGGAGGAIGMTIGDLFDPVYVVYAPKTFLLKLCIGLITGLIAHRMGHITHTSDKKKILLWTDPGGRRGRAGVFPEASQGGRRHGAAEKCAVFRHGGGQPALGG